MNTFLTTLCLIVDEFCHSQSPKSPGPQTSFSESKAANTQYKDSGKTVLPPHQIDLIADAQR